MNIKRSIEPFNWFSLDYLEGRDALRRINYSMTTKKILEQSLYCLSATELVELIVSKKKFDCQEQELIKFWGALFRSKELFEISEGVLTDETFEKLLTNFIHSRTFLHCFEHIDWKYVFIDSSNLILMDIPHFYENIAIGTLKSNTLTVELIEKLDTNGIDWNYKGIDDKTVLMHACSIKVNFNLIKYLLSKKVNINIQNAYRDNAFMLLTGNESISIDSLKLFLDRGIALNIQDKLGKTAFMKLCENKAITVEILLLFINKNLDMEIRDNYGQTALMKLCENKGVTIDMLKLLLNNNVNINIRDDLNYNAFRYLCKNKAVTVDMLKLFLEKDTDIYTLDSSGTTPFIDLCYNKAITVDILKLFLNKGENVNTQDNYKRTAFMNICTHETVTIDTVKLFIDNGADINIKDNCGRVVMDYYTSVGGIEQEILKLLRQT